MKTKLIVIAIITILLLASVARADPGAPTKVFLPLISARSMDDDPACKYESYLSTNASIFGLDTSVGDYKNMQICKIIIHDDWLHFFWPSDPGDLDYTVYWGQVPATCGLANLCTEPGLGIAVQAKAYGWRFVTFYLKKLSQPALITPTSPVLP